jgi:EAL domain-containing protein (putative c-di-GMP-specific phosphodiesterase class I)/DNA-binding response OmpR family regulator
METKKNNILILDPGYYGKSILREILVKSGFDVHLSASETDAAAAIDTFKPDIILCRASGKMIKNNSLMCGLHDLAAGRRIPFAVVSSGADVDFYLRGLERGLVHAITAPFNGEFLVSRVRDILEHDTGGADDNPVSLRLSYHGSDYAFRMRPDELSQFILSLVQDEVNHAGALSDLMQKRKTLHERICRPDMFDGVRSKSEDELLLESELYGALERKEFALHYQPIISLDDDRIAGFEALIRWNHPERGMIMPSDFIPVAERNPLIIPLGFWIIDEAVRQFSIWGRNSTITREMHMGINLSANQFVHPDLGSSIAGILKKYGVAPERIVFEITESAFMTDMETANVQLLRLKSVKHGILMDDFGTGYSSLSYLQHFPVDTLKIDRSFVRWMHIDEQSEHIVRSIVGLAHNLGLQVIAEGVEEEVHRTMLRGLKCDFGQGYLFSPPLDAHAAGEFIRTY